MATHATLQKYEYDRENSKRYGLKLNLKTDADIIAQLDAQSSMQGYIRRLIREDIARHAADPAQTVSPADEDGRNA